MRFIRIVELKRRASRPPLAQTLTGDKPAGTIRITLSEHAAQTILWPGVRVRDYPVTLGKLIGRVPNIS